MKIGLDSDHKRVYRKNLLLWGTLTAVVVGPAGLAQSWKAPAVMELPAEHSYSSSEGLFPLSFRASGRERESQREVSM